MKKIKPKITVNQLQKEQELTPQEAKQELQLISLKAKKFMHEKNLENVVNKDVLLDLVMAYLTRLHHDILNEPNKIAQEVKALSISGATPQKIEKLMLEYLESKLILTYNSLKKKSRIPYRDLKKVF